MSLSTVLVMAVYCLHICTSSQNHAAEDVAKGYAHQLCARACSAGRCDCLSEGLCSSNANACDSPNDSPNC